MDADGRARDTFIGLALDNSHPSLLAPHTSYGKRQLLQPRDAKHAAVAHAACDAVPCLVVAMDDYNRRCYGWAQTDVGGWAGWMGRRASRLPLLGWGVVESWSWAFSRWRGGSQTMTLLLFFFFFPPSPPSPILPRWQQFAKIHPKDGLLREKVWCRRILLVVQSFRLGEASTDPARPYGSSQSNNRVPWAQPGGHGISQRAKRQEQPASKGSQPRVGQDRNRGGRKCKGKGSGTELRESQTQRKGQIMHGRSSKASLVGEDIHLGHALGLGQVGMAEAAVPYGQPSSPGLYYR
ncbi:hypothetical protein CKAH01_00396 [Colletotrichum kahawae]|uniref:Uncharacterized protein n=1 Tax=Colletotrichum kahawae TaxID=34407 RepID=A0AAD9YUZ9_COLKA|nr:hypothetical protein CKAH01_00396 [Colletotrichum kahawae]